MFRNHMFSQSNLLFFKIVLLRFPKPEECHSFPICVQNCSVIQNKSCNGKTSCRLFSNVMLHDFKKKLRSNFCPKVFFIAVHLSLVL